MTATIDLVLAILGAALVFWAITATNKNPGARAIGGGVGLIALLVALILRGGEDHHDRRDWS